MNIYFYINNKQPMDKQSFFILDLFFFNLTLYRQIGSYESEADLSVEISLVLLFFVKMSTGGALITPIYLRLLMHGNMSS